MKANTLSEKQNVHDAVRQNYAKVATGPQSGCCGNDRPTATPADELGYSAEEIAALPEGADLGLGCGNPQAIASLKPGETVLDLGSGAGFDCFLASRSVGPTGRVIGVDMTPEMITRAIANAAKINAMNVEFRPGQIEQLPVADNSIDAIISNCVINLSPDKAQVFREAFRVLKPGGRIAVADIVRTAELPPEIASDLAALCGCVAGAASVDELDKILHNSGFQQVRIRPKDASKEFIRTWTAGRNAAEFVVSSTIEAFKPNAAGCGPACCQ
jgi:ubiquinone/menaquinone biosynthesis C-methylase UbiE